MSFSRWTIDDQLKIYNRAIIKPRRNKCPANYQWSCSKCFVGYDICPAGCRAISLPQPKPIQLTIKGIEHDTSEVTLSRS